MSQKIKKKLEHFFQKGSINLKLNVYIRHYFLKEKDVAKIILGCVYFDFYVSGNLYKIGCMLEAEFDNRFETIISVNRKGMPFLEDKSAIMLKDEELNYLNEKYIIPMFSLFIDNGEIPYFKERIYESIDEEFFNFEK